MRRGKNEDSRYCIVDREDWQGYNKCLAWDPHAAERTLVLGMIRGSGVAVDRHRKGKEEETAQKPDDGDMIQR